jgi:hypothetical protein
VKTLGLKIGGSKEELLGRLGVPTRFEEELLHKMKRGEENEILKILKKWKEHNKAAVHHQKKQKKASHGMIPPMKKALSSVAKLHVSQVCGVMIANLWAVSTGQMAACDRLVMMPGLWQDPSKTRCSMDPWVF